MTPKAIAALLAVGMMATSALALAQAPGAQPAYDPAMVAKGYADVGSPNTPKVNAVEAPITAGLNNQADASANRSNEAEAQYQADRAAYQDALVRHDAAVDRTDARYARQQRAYADAMAAWRVQVQACKRGHQRACDMPPPNVADYY